MFAGFHDMDPRYGGDDSDRSRQSSPRPGSMNSPRSVCSTHAKARLQDKQIEKGKAVMMRDYIPTHINIMLYGESGLGKTTCIRNFIGSWDIEEMGAAFKNGGRTSLELFRQDPNNLKIKLKPLRSEEANRDLLITFQDMPGWGDDINLVNSLRTVVHHLLRQRQLDFHAQDGGFPLNGAAHHRGVLQNAITVCLYFVPPHRIKPVDWIMMSAIGKLCAVVPVIAKADTFTAQEMEDFKKEIMEVITAAATKSTPPSPILRPTTSGCGAATNEGMQSTVSTNSAKSTPMTPAAAAARMGGSDGSRAHAHSSSSDGTRLAPRSSNDVPNSRSAGHAGSTDGGKTAADNSKAVPSTAGTAKGANSTAGAAAADSKNPAGKASTTSPSAAKSGAASTPGVALSKLPGAAASSNTSSTGGSKIPTAAAAGGGVASSAHTNSSGSKIPNASAAGSKTAGSAFATATPAATAAAAAAGPATNGLKALDEASSPAVFDEPSLSTPLKMMRSVTMGDGEMAACIELARDLGLQTYAFNPAALEAIDADPTSLPPFALVGSPDFLPADAPEVEGLCCPMGERSVMPRELWPSPGDPYRRYPWGTAFPLNRSHSDLIILKQLLTGHCNSAIYDLLDESWRRACHFAEKYRKLLLKRAHESVKDLLTMNGLLDPMVDEVCNNGRMVPLEDRLRDEEQKKLQAELERAAGRLRELEETVRAQRRALSSMQQQLATVLQEKSGGGFFRKLGSTSTK